jgi:hypothetical protein
MYSLKEFTLALGLSFCLSLSLYADWDGFQSYIIINRGNGNEYFAGGWNADGGLLYNNQVLGRFTSSNTLMLNGGEIKTWKNGNSNVCGGALYYKIYRSCEDPGLLSFSSVNLPFDSNLPNPGDQKWDETAAGINVLNGLASGTYVIEIYWRAEGNQNNPGGCGEFKFDSNGGANWKGYFEYDNLDAFTDNNFTSGPVWSGDTDDWLIVADNDAASGATNARSLRLNATVAASGSQYLSTPFTDWQTDQTWSFWVGRHNQAYTSTNQFTFWLYANEANLESPTVDGYRILIGDNLGNDDVRLQVVTDGVGTTILIAGEIPNAITDIGVSFKIVRLASGAFEVFTSSLALLTGEGTTANSCPLNDATISQGTVINNAYNPSGTGYIGVVALHTSLSDPRTAVSVDQIRLIGETISVPGCTDNYAMNYNPLATYDDGSCDYPNLVFTEIHYNPNDGAGYPDIDYEFVEIFNNELVPVNLSGYTFTAGFTFTFPPGSVINAGEYIVVAANSATYTGNGYQVFQYSGALNNSGEALTLSTGASLEIESVTYDDANPWPVSANGAGPSAQLIDLSLDNTIGSNWFGYGMNGTPGTAPIEIPGCLDPSANNFSIFANTDDYTCTYDPASVVINELHYNPCPQQGNDADFEFVELFNTTASTIDLSGWELTGFDFTFPLASSIAPGEYIIIATNPPIYSGNGYQVYGPVAGGLFNSGEAITLSDNQSNVVDFVFYGDVSPWPLSPGGNCASLELSDPLNNNYYAGSWQGSYVEFGSPGGPNSGLFVCADCEDPGSTSNDILTANFENGSLGNWTEGTPGDWAVSTLSPISGAYSLKHNLNAVSGISQITRDLDCILFNGVCTTWQFQVANEAWDPDATARFMVYLAANEENLNSATIDGYAVGINYVNNTDRLALYRITNGVATVLIQGAYDMNASNTLSIEVVKNADNEWMLRYDTNGGFDNMLAASPTPVSDNTYTEGRYFGLVFDFANAAVAGGIRFDNISITQCGLETIYYSISSGNTQDAIWSSNENAVIGETITFGRYKRIVVQTGHTVTANGLMIADDFSTESGGTFDGGAEDIVLFGNFINDGALLPSTSTFKLKGISPQLIAGANSIEFWNLSMENPSFAVLAVSTGIRNVLYPAKGTLNSNGNLRLLGDATYTGYIAPFGQNALINGSVIFNTYLQATSGASWFTTGAQTTGLDYSDWNDDMVTVGFPGSDFPNALDFINIATYEESIPGTLEQGYQYAGDISDPINTTKGTWVYEFADALTLDATGPVRKGNIVVDLSHTNNQGDANDGWNLIYNVYPAPVDLEALVANSDPEPGVGPDAPTTFYMWNPSVNAYQTYQALTMVGNAPRFVAPSQAFWVRAEANHLDFVFDEWIKDVDQTGLNILRDEPAIPQITIALEQPNVQDQAFLLFREGAQTWNDPMDAPKLFSFNTAAPNLAFGESMQTAMAISALPSSALGNTSIPIFVNALAGGTVSISFPEIRYMPDNLCLSLEDLVTGEVFPVSQETSLEFALSEATSDVRFILHMNPVVTAEITSPICTGSAEGSIYAETYLGSSAQFQWFNEEGILLSVEPGATSSQINNLSAGTYYVVVSGNELLCGDLTIPFNLDDPEQETAWHTGFTAGCNIAGEGAIAFDVSAESYNYSLLGNDVTLEGNGVSEAAYIENLNPGTYELILSTLCNSWAEIIELSDVMAVNANAQPSASELTLTNGEAAVSFSNASTGAVNYLWDFGDGTSSELEHPIHIYTEPGVYTATLTAYNEVCQEIQSFQILVHDQAVNASETTVQDFSLVTMSDHYLILIGSEVFTPGQIQLFDASGRLVMDRSVNLAPGSAIRVDTGTLSSGLYSLIVLDNSLNALYRTRIMK